MKKELVVQQWIDPSVEPVTLDEIYRVMVTLDKVITYLSIELHKAGIVPCAPYEYYRLEDQYEDSKFIGPVVTIIFENPDDDGNHSTYAVDIPMGEILLPIPQIVELAKVRHIAAREQERIEREEREAKRRAEAIMMQENQQWRIFQELKAKFEPPTFRS